MSDNKHPILVSAMEPSDNRQPDSEMGPAHGAPVPVGTDGQLVREYREAFLLIHKVHGQMQGLAADGNLIEIMLDGGAEERQASIEGTKPHPIEEQVLATLTDSPMAEPAPPMAGQVFPTMTFTELARLFSEQMEEVVATGKQISAASQQMASGVKELNKGVGMLKRKLSRVKY